MVSIILWSRVQVPAGPPNQKTNPSSGWSFFAYSRVLARVRAGSCGLRGFPRAPGLGRFHSLLAILLSGVAPLVDPKSTSAPNCRVTNQQLTRGPIKRLIRGIGRRRKQQRKSSDPKMLDLWLVGEQRSPIPRPFVPPARASARRPVLPLTGLSKFRADE